MVSQRAVELGILPVPVSELPRGSAIEPLFVAGPSFILVWTFYRVELWESPASCPSTTQLGTSRCVIDSKTRLKVLAGMG